MWYELTTCDYSIFCCDKHLAEVTEFWKTRDAYKRFPEKCFIVPRAIKEPEWTCGECTYQQMVYESETVVQATLGGRHKFPKSTSFYLPQQKDNK
jgi:hypothetical protein